MRDLSLHILDLLENSIRAGATLVAVTVIQDQVRDWLTIKVEDNGFGIQDPIEQVADPFYTTKPGKKTGLGLSLFKAAAERTGGSLEIGTSELGGASVQASLRLRHLDRCPLGDLAATLSSMVCTNPGLELVCRLCVDGKECVVNSAILARDLPAASQGGLALARRVSEKIKSGMAALTLSA